MIRQNAIMKARIERLEKRAIGNPLKRQVIFALAERPRGGDDVIGMTDNFRFCITRQGGEQLEAFERRAAAVSGARVLFRVYRTPGTAAEHPEAAPWHSAPLQA